MKSLFIILLGFSLTSVSLSQSCLPEGIHFWYQEQIDSFQINYPNCTEIEGPVIISSLHNIINLNGLNMITQIGGGLKIESNDELTNLTGLENLMSIGGNLEINQNELLSSLTGLENLIALSGDLIIEGNESLIDLIPLGNIEAGTIKNINIYENHSLSNCNAQSICDYLLSPTGYLLIFNNAVGCNNPHEIATYCSISLLCLPYGVYYLTTQADINSFQTFYPGCTDLHGGITINGDDITNLDGLNVITSVTGYVEISYNLNLTSISGLENVTFIGQDLFILGNYNLTTLWGLENIEADSLDNLYIYNNHSLSYCEVQSICDYLGNPNGRIDIEYNAPGCSTQAEVEAACGVGINDIISLKHPFTISPNPSSSQITIETTIYSPKFQISIFNLNGQEVIKQQFTKPMAFLNISELPAGLYFVRVTGECAVGIQKFIKID